METLQSAPVVLAVTLPFPSTRCQLQLGHIIDAPSPAGAQQPAEATGPVEEVSAGHCLEGNNRPVIYKSNR